ncbi:uncharacterized protein DS421_1g29750 [Arachis hypogaea]|nr:uncharacterized protein DS421_1g29750 [Arachis hypogaea]
MATISIILVLFLLLILIANEATAVESIIGLGKSLSPKGNNSNSNNPCSWSSSPGNFAFGFYPHRYGYALGIWLLDTDNTVVWTANRDGSPLPSTSTLQLTTQGLLLRQEEEAALNITNFSFSNLGEEAASASMLDDGGQRLINENKLISDVSKTDHSSIGLFYLIMQRHNNLVSYPLQSLPYPSDAYFVTGTSTSASCTFTYHLYLNHTTGSLLIRNDTNLMPIRSLFVAAENENKNKNTIIYRATLDFDGVFRLYAHDMANKVISIVKTWPDNSCSVKGFCGFNSYCALADENPFCYCLPGFDYLDPNQNSLGCKRNFSEDKCSEEEFYRMVSLDKLAWHGDRSYFQAQMADEEHCSSSCFIDCNCWAASYDQSSKICMKQQTPLRYARRVQLNEEVPSLKFFKVGNLNLIHVSSEPVPETPLSHKIIKNTSNKAILHIVFVTSIFTLIFCSTIGIPCHLMSKIRVLKYRRLLEIGDLGLNEEVALRRFSYTELKRATNGFKQELGKGSFGAVYKGVLYKAGRSRRFIAVKRLEKLVEDGEREFQAEVRAIGKTHHRNLVRLLGFCAEGPKRLLVYEYMSNGSLGKLLFGDERLPDWDERVRIALDIARGILYLHEECEAPIIHCDIKPQNILMDEFWTAKISDFGLAKLLMPDQTRTFTGVRGTRGYLAPEWNRNTPITVKADIYSYGIVLLETCFVAGEVHKLVHWEEVDKNVVENMVKVALWCIQHEPVLRPSMKSVVLMLEGVTDVPVPPSPTSNSM